MQLAGVLYEPLHHKYRPQTFAQLVGQGAIADTLTHALEQNRIAPAYLFCGPRGTGKTSSARILAKSLNCLKAEGPTPKPCGKCDVCQSVSRGNALDIVEIDAASNTGVDNIRELIERAQFAPVQCRYKAYVIDECLTGDTQVETDAGNLRIDDPRIIGRKVLSYNETLRTWEFKKVARLMDRGERQTYTVKTNCSKIKCTGNHLIRTESGWTAAKDLKEGMRILSPASVDVAPSSSSTEPIGASADLSEVISSKETHSGKSLTTSMPSLQQWNPTVLYAPAAAENGSKYLSSCKRRDTGSKEFFHAGESTLSKQNTGFGRSEPKILLPASTVFPRLVWGSSTELCWEIAPLLSQTHTADSLDLPGHIAKLSSLGRNIKQADYLSYARALVLRTTKGTEKPLLSAAQHVIQSLWKSFKLSIQTIRENESLPLGSTRLRLKELLGGIWMTDRLASPREVVRVFDFILKDLEWKKISSLLAGLQSWDIQSKRAAIQKLEMEKPTITSRWELLSQGNFWPTSSPSQSRQWHTNLETVRSVQLAGVESVYDIEVEDNHNFVANGLLVHNCHMLSTAAFNALLKTLEEPPDRVVFVLATTDPQRVLPTIISRCQRFDFRRIPLPAMIKHLAHIAEKEKIQIAQSAVQLVAQISQGGLRDAESLLDQLSLQADEITVETVWDLVGAVPERDLLNLVRAIAADDGTALIDRVRHLMDKGREPLIVLQSLVGFYRDLLIAKTAPTREDLVAITPPTWAEMTAFAQKLPAAQILASQQKLQTAEVQVKNTTQPRLWLEITLTSLLPSALGALSTLSENVPTVKRAIANPSVSQSIPPAPVPIPSKSTPVKSEQISQLSSEKPSGTEHQPDDIAQPTETNIPTESSSPESEENLPSKPPQSSPEVAFGSLTDLWNRILGALEPRGTQMLMSQQGMLLAFDGVGAKVGFKSAQLQKMARERVPNLEKALESIFKRPIKVSLEIVSVAETSTNSAKQTTSSAPPQQSSPPDRSPSDNAAEPRRNPSGNQQNTDRSANPPINPAIHHQSPASQPSDSSKSQPPDDLPDSNTDSGPPPSPDSSVVDNLPSAPSSATPGQWQTNQEQDNIKRFAQFFNGQIVNLDDDLEPTPPESNQPPEKSSEPGPDVPF